MQYPRSSLITCTGNRATTLRHPPRQTAAKHACARKQGETAKIAAPLARFAHVRRGSAPRAISHRLESCWSPVVGVRLQDGRLPLPEPSIPVNRCKWQACKDLTRHPLDQSRADTRNIGRVGTYVATLHPSPTSIPYAVYDSVTVSYGRPRLSIMISSTEAGEASQRTNTLDDAGGFASAPEMCSGKAYMQLSEYTTCFRHGGV